MKKKSFITVLSLIIVLSLVFAVYFYTWNGNASVFRIENSIYSESGQLLFNSFYEKPIISEKYPGAEKINEFFDIKCNEFFTREDYKRMKDDFDEKLGYWGEAVMSKQPFCYYNDAEITYLTDKYISVRLSRVWFGSGSCEVWNDGITFNLHTGERVSFSEFSDIESKLLKENMGREISETYLSKEWGAEVVKMFKEDTENDFSFVYKGSEVPFDKDFFYDGKKINITLGDEFITHNGLIYCWDAKDINSGCVYFYRPTYEKLEKHVYEDRNISKPLKTG